MLVSVGSRTLLLEHLKPWRGVRHIGAAHSPRPLKVAVFFFPHVALFSFGRHHSLPLKALRLFLDVQKLVRVIVKP